MSRGNGTFYGIVASRLELATLSVENFFRIGGDEMARRSFAFAVVAVILVHAAANGEKADGDAAAGDSKLPIKRVVMFSSGVGYFQHQGKVEGDASVDLKFRVNNINDLITSMVLADSGG